VNLHVFLRLKYCLRVTVNAVLQASYPTATRNKFCAVSSPGVVPDEVNLMTNRTEDGHKLLLGHYPLTPMFHLCSSFFSPHELLRLSERASFIDGNLCNVKILSNYIKQVTSKIRLYPDIYLCVSCLIRTIEFPSLYCLFLKQYIFCLS